MATRSNIAIEDAPGRGRQIYCHWDGYPSNNGAILLEHYTTQEKVEALIALGNISSLGALVAPPDGVAHSYDTRAEGVTVAYHRDRGEALEPARVQAPACEQDYLYVWRGQWWFMPYGGVLEVLTRESCGLPPLEPPALTPPPALPVGIEVAAQNHTIRLVPLDGAPTEPGQYMGLLTRHAGHIAGHGVDVVTSHIVRDGRTGQLCTVYPALQRAVWTHRIEVV